MRLASSMGWRSWVLGGSDGHTADFATWALRKQYAWPDPQYTAYCRAPVHVLAS